MGRVKKYYCDKHKYNPPANSGFCLCPQCELGDEFPVTVWYGCYNRQWTTTLIPDCFKHPAKFAPGLVDRILRYGAEKGYWAPGMRMGDPFGGVGCGAVVAADQGYEWIGQELEKEFVEIGNRNIDANRARWKQLGRTPPILVQGDSRQFAETVAGVLTSPPYNLPFAQEHSGSRGGKRAQGQGKGVDKNSFRTYGQNKAQIDPLPHGTVDGAITSPPFIAAQGGMKGKSGDCADPKLMARHYRGEGGDDRSDANIEKLKPGTLLDGGITSPPYETIHAGAGGLNHKPAKKAGQQSGRKKAGSQDTDQRYGSAEGQIAKLRKSSVDVVLASPPHGDTLRRQKDGIDWKKAKREKSGGGEHQKRGKSLHATYGQDPANIGNLGGVVTSPPYDRNKAKGHVGADAWSDPERAAKHMSASGKGHSASPEARQRQFERDKGKSYGQSQGQIGRKAGETYWMAVAKVYSSCFECIKPGGYICIIVKNYVRQWKIVDLTGDTMRLLEHVGFEPVEEIRAMLREETVEHDLFEGEITKVRERKSFFRRLQEQRGAPRIDYESVLVVRKPLK